MARVNIDQQKKIATSHRLAGRHVHRASLQMFTGARRLAPRGDHRSGSGVRKPGVPLVQSLKIQAHSATNMITERIGSDKEYAASMHQGSSPHYINSHGKMLKFEWERGSLLMAARSSGRIKGRGRSRKLRQRGNFFYFVTVHHPGNKRPVRYLTTPMHLYGRIHGFRTTSTPVSRSRLP